MKLRIISHNGAYIPQRKLLWFWYDITPPLRVGEDMPNLRTVEGAMDMLLRYKTRGKKPIVVYNEP